MLPAKMDKAFQERFVVFPQEPERASSVSVAAKQDRRLSAHVVTDLSGVEDLQPVWRRWTHDLDTDFDYYINNVNSDPTIVCPYVVAVYENGAAVALLVGLVREQTVSTVVSFVKIRGPRVKVLEIVHGGRMGRQSAAIDRLLAVKLRDATRSANVDLLCLQRLPLKSELFRMLRESGGLLQRGRVPHVFRYSIVPLKTAQGKGVRALSSKYGRETRRKNRILQRYFPGRVCVRCFSQPEQLEVGLRDVASVAVATWQHYLGCGLLDLPHNREKLSFCAKQGWLRIHVMYIDDSPVAFLIGQHYKRSFVCQYAGYHPDFARFSVGSLLTAWVLEHLATDGVEEVDLGEGDQEHNRRLKCLDRDEGTVHLYSPTLRGVYSNVLFSVTQGIRVAGRSTIRQLHLNGASKAWSRFLISRWTAGSRKRAIHVNPKSTYD